MVFVLVGTIFVPIGVASLLASRKVVEIVDRYDDAYVPANMTHKLAYIQNSTISKTCTRTLKVPKNMTPSVFVYYQLDNFFQNHRRGRPERHGLKGIRSRRLNGIVTFILDRQPILESKNHSLFAKTEMLVRPLDCCKSIDDAHAKGMPIAWPSICVQKING